MYVHLLVQIIYWYKLFVGTNNNYN